MDIDQLLTSTRSARKTLDLDAPVDRDMIAECLRIARARLRALADRAEILEGSAYHDDAVDDHVAFVGPVEGVLDRAFACHRVARPLMVRDYS